MTMWLECGGAAWSITDAACKRLYDLGARGVHCVVGDMGVYQTELANIKKYGMTPTLDIEIPLWVNTGMNANADISWAKPALQLQRNAGWKYFSSEGLGREATDVIRSVGPFINYGSENGANMYAGQYNHTADAHYANVLETYHKWAITDYKNTAVSSWNNVKRQGLTLMMYAADLETDTTALVNYIKDLQALGITISVLHMWCGINSDIQMVFNEPWISVVNAVKNNFGAWGTTATWSDVPTPTPVLGNPIVNLSAQYTIDRKNGLDKIRGRAYDKDNKPSEGRMTGLWEYNEKTKKWVGIAWVPVDNAAYFEYNLTTLLTNGYHILSIWTNDGVSLDLTPYQRWE